MARLTASFTLMMIASSPVMAAAKTVPASALQPSGKWVVEWSDARCTAQISFVEDGRTVTLFLKAPPKDESFQLSLVDKGINADPSIVDTQLAIGTGLREKFTMLVFGKKPFRVRQINLTASQIGQLRSATSVTADSGKGLQNYQLTQLPQVVAQLEKCRTDLLAAWNGDKAGRERVKTPFQGSLVKLFDDEDYPVVALRKDQSGSVEMMLLIDETGKVADCSVTATSGVAALDGQSCAIVTLRSKLKPAMDQQGKPMRSVMLQKVS